MTDPVTGAAGPPSPREAVEASPGGLPAALEALLIVAEGPVPAAELSAAVGYPAEEVTAALIELAAEYRGALGARPRGFELREVGGGWRLFSAAGQAALVARTFVEGQTARLTQAALETLAVIAYRQPVTRGRVSAIRGVNVDSVVRTLLTRGLIEEAGEEEGTGAILYRTSQLFLEKLGLRDLDELAPLAPHLPDAGDLGELEELIER